MRALRLSEEQVREIQARVKRGANVTENSIATRGESPRKAKYRNRWTEIDGEKFHSKREAARYQELKLMEHAGEIVDLKRQVSYDLIVNDMLVCRYIADFVYTDRKGRVTEDTKGHATKDYIIKRKLMLACKGIQVRET